MAKRIAFGVITALLTLTIVGCGGQAMPAPVFSEEREAMPVEMPAEAPAAEIVEKEAGGGAGDYAAVERLIIRNASLDIVVRDTEGAVDEIGALAEESGGFVVESSLSEYQEGKRAHLTIRVPGEKLDAVLDRIRELAMEVRRESISGQDVTDEYVDLQSRLRHLQATEERLLTFMEEAEDTEAALEVYDRLQSIQSQIEQTKGRMQYLEESAALATIALDITPSELAQPIEVGGWRPRGTLRNAFESLIRVLQFLVDALIVIVVLVAPILAVVALPLVGLFFLIRWIVRRRRRAEPSEQPHVEHGLDAA